MAAAVMMVVAGAGRACGCVAWLGTETAAGAVPSAIGNTGVKAAATGGASAAPDLAGADFDAGLAADFSCFAVFLSPVFALDFAPFRYVGIYQLRFHCDGRDG